MTVVLTVLVVLVALGVSMVGGWLLTGAVLRLAGRSADAGSAGAGPGEGAPVDASQVSDGPDGARAREVLRGGTWIGILERLAVTGCVLTGQVTAIALVIAVKGLGRYPELRENPGVSERFVIGTLASMIWAVLVGLGARALLLLV